MKLFRSDPERARFKVCEKALRKLDPLLEKFALTVSAELKNKSGRTPCRVVVRRGSDGLERQISITVARKQPEQTVYYLHGHVGGVVDSAYRFIPCPGEIFRAEELTPDRVKPVLLRVWAKMQSIDVAELGRNGTVIPKLITPDKPPQMKDTRQNEF